MKLEHAPGATPLSPEELAGLLPDLTTQGELNEWEHHNILAAERWLLRHPSFATRLLTDGGLRSLHRRMFERTWRWAGRYRGSDTNIGVPWAHVSSEVKKLCDDVRFWLANGTFPWTELAARFHHRLVEIHPFPNGNGRHARLATDALLHHHGEARLAWGSGDLVAAGRLRSEYIAALREADQGSYARLIAFVRS